MGRAGQIDLSEFFLRVQRQMLAHFAAGELIGHSVSCGAATEQQWIRLLNEYLPKRYRAASAFVVDADGRRSRQIDIAIYDHFYSPVLFAHESGLHVPAESVYAVLEVKQSLTAQYLRDAGEKAASVRALRRTSVPVLSAGARVPAKTPAAVLAGIVALDSSWPQEFRSKLPLALCAMRPEERLDLGCALEQGAFEMRSTARGLVMRLSVAQESLIFFVIRLLERLREMGTAPACDLMEYGRSLESFCGREVVLEGPGRDGKERE